MSQSPARSGLGRVAGRHFGNAGPGRHHVHHRTVVATADYKARWLDEMGQVTGTATLTFGKYTWTRWVGLPDGTLLTGIPLAHLTPGGSWDSGIGAGLQSASKIWTVPSSRIYAALTEGPAGRLRRHRGDGSADRRVDVLTDGPLLQLAEASDGALLIAGGFGHVDGIPAPGLAQLLPQADEDGARWHEGGEGFAVAETQGQARVPLFRDKAAADPAQPYGAVLPWPKRSGARAARVAGAQVVLLGGQAALYVERGGRSLVPLREPEDEWLRVALAELVAHVRAGGAKRLAVERFDGIPVAESVAMPLLVEAGFLAGPRRAVLRP